MQNEKWPGVFILPLLILFMMSCADEEPKSRGGKSSESKGAADSVKTTDDAGAAHEEIVVDGPGYVPDYPALYCTHVGKLSLRADVGKELSYFCQGTTPTKEMLDFRQAILRVGQGGRTEIRVLKEKHDEAEEVTDMILLWGYYTKIRPFDVKEKPLYEFISKEISDGDLSYVAVSEPRDDGELDHGLHLWSTDMEAELRVKATNGLDLENAVKTQYNMYQVESGNEEMGLGVNAMSEPENPDYLRYVMINLTTNDGSGYNDDHGGAVIMNMLHIQLRNRGFPKTASDTISKLGDHLASSMFEGLSQ